MHDRSTDPDAGERARRAHLGITLKLLSVLMLGGMSASIKALGRAIPLGETIFVRSAVAVVALALLARFTVGSQVLRTRQPGRHALRSLSGTASMFCLFVALTRMPLADVATIGLTSPLFVTLLAMVFLHERIHGFRWLALGLGGLGALIMTVPHVSWQTPASLGVVMAFGATALTAVAMFFLRSMSGQEHAITITFYFMLTAALCSLLTAPFGWVAPTLLEWRWILLTALFGVAGQLLMTWSYRYAEASTIAPLDYGHALVAIGLGWWLFGEVPGWQVWLGTPLVISSGLLILWREYRLHLPRDPIKPS